MSAIALDIPRKGRWWAWLGPLVLALIMSMGMLILRSSGSGGGGEYTGDCSGSQFVMYDSVHTPDETCTGWEPTGVTLTDYVGSCNLTAGTAIDSKTINCDPLNLNGNDITITRSQINGIVSTNATNRTGLLIQDSVIDGQNAASGVGCVGNGQGNTNGGATAGDYVLDRVEIKGCTQGFYGRGVRIQYSYIHDLICRNMDHIETILANVGETEFLYNTLYTSTRLDTCTAGGGAASAVAVVYTHGADGWDTTFVNGKFIGNYFKPSLTGPGQPVFCVYSGEYGGAKPGGTATGLIWEGNYFDRGPVPPGECGYWSDWGGGGPVYTNQAPNGSGSCWSNNRYADDGDLITPSDAVDCP